MSNRKNLIIALTIFLFAFSSAESKNNTPLISIIPKPENISIGKGSFEFSRRTKIWTGKSSPELQKLGNLISAAVNNSSGWRISAAQMKAGNLPPNLVLLKILKDSLPEGSYRLDITQKRITLTAGSGSGLFYAVQSLLQMMPVNPGHKNFRVPCLTITDRPRFQWRGVHLDVCRHIFPVEFIRKYIDLLAMYKMNVFHWHLTEDQGWRIEIKKYPELTKTGGMRKETMHDGIPYGGFYTQDQIKEIVAYAGEKYITIVPEIEMPGHSMAALAAYPRLSCTGGPFETATTWGVFDDIYCAGNDQVFDFLEDVLTEVMALFPGKYIHIGGDEAPKERWKACPKCQARIKAEGLKDESQLQSYFIRRIEKFLNEHGKNIIGWDEILEGGLAANAAVMSWRGIDGGIAAAKANHNAVMTPGDFCYFDRAQGLNGEPKSIGGFLPLSTVYSYEPVPEKLSADEAKYIIGAQANMWSEYFETTSYVEYMLLPRLCALSEVVWTPASEKNYTDFSNRLLKHYELLASRNINFRIPPPTDGQDRISIQRNKTLKLSSPVKGSTIRYTVDGTEPTAFSAKYSSPLRVKAPVILKSKIFLQNGKTSPTSTSLISPL